MAEFGPIRTDDARPAALPRRQRDCDQQGGEGVGPPPPPERGVQQESGQRDRRENGSGQREDAVAAAAFASREASLSFSCPS
jgi:hypothetical protein